MVPKPEESAETVPPKMERRGRFKMVTRRRLNVSLLSPSIEKLNSLCLRFGVTRGPILDKCISALYDSYEGGELRCATGRECLVHNKDLPASL